MTAYEPDGPAPRRLVLIDFDWQDADVVPDLIRSPSVSVRLVAGSGPEDAGLRVAELCGLPRSTELADLTREIFDLALLGQSSPRRLQVERLLRALGTPVRSPVGFVANGGVERRATADGSHVDAESAWSLDHPQPVEALTAAGHDTSPDAANGHAPEPLPDLHDALGWERTLAEWVRHTSAFSAELHRVEGDRRVRVCRVGPEDALLDSLIEIAQRVGTPQVVLRAGEPQDGAVWGAWPVRTGRVTALLAVAAADPQAGQAFWKAAARSLRSAGVEPGSPSPEAATRLNVLTPDAFEHRLEMAVDRHHADGFRFALHRLRFDAPADVVDTLVRSLPDRLRGTDALCRVSPRELLLLCAGPTGAFLVVRARIQAAWEQCWIESGRPGRAPELADDRLEIREPADARAFLAAARGWLARA